MDPWNIIGWIIVDLLVAIMGLGVLTATAEAIGEIMATKVGRACLATLVTMAFFVALFLLAPVWVSTLVVISAILFVGLWFRHWLGKGATP